METAEREAREHDRWHDYRQRRREDSGMGGHQAAVNMTPEQRAERARAGAQASRSPMAHARALAKAWERLPEDERVAVWAELYRWRYWAHVKAWNSDQVR